MLLSCTKDLPFPSMEIMPKPVVNSFISVGDTIKLKFSETYSPNDSFATNVPVANVNLFDSSGIQIDFFTYDPITNEYISNTIAEASKTYQVEVLVTSKFYQSTSYDRTPRVKPSVVVDTSTTFFQGKSNFFQFKMTLSDDPQEKNYYLLYCIRNYYEYSFQNGNIVDSVLKQKKLELKTNDFWFARNNNVQYSKEELILVDNGFEGLAITTNFGVDKSFLNSENEKTISVDLHISSLSENRYLYTSSLNEYLFHQADPFSQPTSVFSNIEGGYGILASDNTEVFKFEF